MVEKSKESMLREVTLLIEKCTKCPLYKTRTKPVPGEGNPDARIMFVGEAPGYHEDKQGRPFVGAAGKLLTELIENVLELTREDVFITNVVKCRPPKNRDPLPEEIEACSPYLDMQIDIIDPDIIVCLGRHSSRYILTKIGVNFRSILSVRGKVFEWKRNNKTVLVIPTIHPAAALYKGGWRSFLVEDFKKIKLIISGNYEQKRRTTLDIYLH